jgi:phospho-N-acetylmuramoyl-pentapeptide-transferase
MLYLLVRNHRFWLESHRLGFLRLFQDVTFQSTMATILSFAIVLLLGPRTIAWLRRQKIGDNPSFDQPELDHLMRGKRGVPTMGGILIIAAIALTVLALADLNNFYVRMALVCLIWLGAVGAVDDWLKLASHRRQIALAMERASGGDETDFPSGSAPVREFASAAHAGAGRAASRPIADPAPLGTAVAAPAPAAGATTSRQGLTGLEKLLFQVGLAVVLAVFTYGYGVNNEASHTLFFPFVKQLHVVLPMWAFIAICAVVLTGTSNAVNLTDGVDGLAAGCMAIASFAFVVLALIAGADEFRFGSRSLTDYLYLPHIAASDQMAVIAGAMVGACVGFLWFNCNPARVFMGDTGSLALGGLIGYIAIVIRQELLLFLIGGIFVVEAMSVMIQVSYFKYTRRRFGQGRRVFLMSPLHHHFQRKGWTETQVVVRFWLIGAMLAMLALATVKIR